MTKMASLVVLATVLGGCARRAWSDVVQLKDGSCVTYTQIENGLDERLVVPVKAKCPPDASIGGAK